MAKIKISKCLVFKTDNPIAIYTTGYGVLNGRATGAQGGQMSWVNTVEFEKFC